MGHIGYIRILGILLVGMLFFCWPAADTAFADSVRDIVDGFIEANKGNVETVEKIDASQAVAALKAEPVAAWGVLEEALSDENRNNRILAAVLLDRLSEDGDAITAIDKDARKNFPEFEALKKELIRAYKRNDPALQEPVHNAWRNLFPGQNLFSEAAADPPVPDYKTSYFYLHSGGMLLNPYTITKNDAGTYMLEGSGEADARFFVEAMYRNRYAWIEKDKKKWAMDYEMRLGVSSSDSDPSGAVVSGSGDAYMEFSVGFLFPDLGNFKLNNLDDVTDEGVRWTMDVEGLAGFVTDKGAQALHFYWGVGPVVAVGIPYIHSGSTGRNRRIEVMGGVYWGETDMPQFVDEHSRAIVSANDFPEFKHETAYIWRGDIHFPFGENGFVTITGRFTSNWGKESVSPWNIAIGYTIPLEVVTDSVTTLFNQ